MSKIDVGRKDIQVWGEQREAILLKFKKVLNKWGLTMPKVDSLVLDFGLDNFYKEGLIEYWIANEEKEGYCGKFLFVFDRQTCPFHHHNIKHETFFVVRGSVTMWTDNKSHVMKAGDIQIMPPGVIHSFTGRDNALLLEVSKPCVLNDSIFANKAIGNNGII